jgi:hypothetical protein
MAAPIEIAREGKSVGEICQQYIYTEGQSFLSRATSSSIFFL